MSIELPASCIPETADSVISRHKSFAAIWFMLLGLFALGSLAFVFGDSKTKVEDYSVFGGMVFWVALFGLLAALRIRGIRIARRVAEAARDPQFTWYLNGKLIVAADASGAPRPGLALKLTGHMRDVLTAVPRAQATFKS